MGLLVGYWKPSSLDTHPSNPLKPIENSDVGLGLLVVSPSLQGVSLRFQAYQWSTRYQVPGAEKKVKLRHLSLDIKQQLLSQIPASPYATFGMAMMWARESLPFSTSEAGFNRMGYGFQVGAGLDAQILSHLGVALEYQYFYAKFDHSVGQTDNYSGPNLSLRIHYWF